jgi:hypothetical protein
MTEMLQERRALYGDLLSSWSNEDLARLAGDLGRYNRTIG